MTGFYYFFSFLAIFFSICVPLVTQPIYSAIFLVLTFFWTALSLLSLRLEFLPLIYILVCVGAVAVLFLFIIMMVRVRQVDNFDFTFFFWFSVVSFKLSFFFSNLIPWSLGPQENYYFEGKSRLSSFAATSNVNFFSNDSLIFNTLLYSSFGHFFVLSSVLLLTSMVGSISIFHQNSRYKLWLNK